MEVTGQKTYIPSAMPISPHSRIIRALFLALLLAPHLAPAHGGYGYASSSLAYYGKHDLRASYQQGMALGLALQFEPLRSGYTLSGDRLYIPVNSLLPLSLYALDELGVGKNKSLWYAGNTASLPNGFRIGFAYPPYISIMGGHHLEIYAPHLGVSEILDLSLHLYCIEGTLYRRFSSVSSLSESGASIGIAWMFD